MAEYIDRDGYIKLQRELYCKNCPKRGGMRNGKQMELYPIGGVVCRACELHDALNALEDFPAADVAPVRHLNADDVYEPFYQWLGEESVSRKWETLRELIDALVESCGAKMDEEEGDEEH